MKTFAKLGAKAGILAATALAGVIAFGFSASAAPGDKTALQSAGALAFAPGGVLLIGDSAGGQIIAVETGDTAKGGPGKVEIADLSAKIAALLGTTADQVAVNDVAVNPVSGSVYLSVSRGLGVDAKPVVLKADRAGKLTEVKVDASSTPRLSFPTRRRPTPRMRAASFCAPTRSPTSVS